MRTGPIFLSAMLLLSCSKTQDAADTSPNASDGEVSTSATQTAVGGPPSWVLLSDGEGVSLALGSGKQATVRFFCPSSKNGLTVNVQSFRPIGSEERFTVGSGNNAATLVADTRGDVRLGGVTGTGAIPDNFVALFSGPLSMNYGAQKSGPHIAPPKNLSKAFVTACNEGLVQTETAQQSVKMVNACSLQDGKVLAVAPRRAIGTEPFWGARIDGRCVHYSHMDDQKGMRVWTRYKQEREGEIWSGALNGQLFELRVRNEPGCSDGMSDKRYPMAVELKVGGEVRRGCAEPA